MSGSFYRKRLIKVLCTSSNLLYLWWYQWDKIKWLVCQCHQTYLSFENTRFTHYSIDIRQYDNLMISGVSLFNIVSTLDKDVTYHLHAPVTWIPPCVAPRRLKSLSLVWVYLYLSLCDVLTAVGQGALTISWAGLPCCWPQPARLGRHQPGTPGTRRLQTSSPEGELGDKEKSLGYSITIFKNVKTFKA